MNKNRILNSLLTTTFICGAVGFAAPAYAQEIEQDAPTTGPVEGADVDVSAQGRPVQDQGDIVVTGSRIPQPNLESISPVTVVNSQEVKLSGTNRVEDLINSLPQTFAGQGSTIANGSTGTATLDLRNLGSDRTLVLVNGRRLMPGSPGQLTAAADVNFIPAALIERVDVLTGGASSVYGADAVAGVVNFIMDTDFEGVRLDAQYSFYNHDNNTNADVIDALNDRKFGYPGGTVADGGGIDVTAVIGAGFDDGRGHVTAYAGYRKIDPVLQAKRDYSSCALQANPTSGPSAGQKWGCGGSGTGFPANFFNGSFSFLGSAGDNRSLVPVNNIYNFGPVNYYQRPDERYVMGAFANYEINSAIEAYGEIMFMDDRTVAQIAPSGNFFSTGTINCDNPLLGAALRTAVCTPGQGNLIGEAAIRGPDPDGDGPLLGPIIGYTPATVFTDPLGNQYTQGGLYMGRRNVEGGGRQDDLQHTDFRIVGGVRGDLSSAWSYDAYYQFGQVNFADTYLNDFSVTRLGRALDVVTNPANGQPVCRSVLTGVDPNCLPYDVFTTGGVTQAAIGYLQTPGFQRGNTKESVLNASLTGDLGSYGLRSPWSTEGVGLNVGVEYRKEFLDLQTDVAFQTNDLAGQGAPTLPVTGEFDVREAFAEMRIPLVQDSFLHDMNLQAGYRYSDYELGNRGFSTDTYKLGLEIAPVRDIRFRAAYNRAVRAPNIIELFAPQRVALNGSFDPCAGAEPEFTPAQCALMGVSAAQYGSVPENPAAQYNGLIGGNPNLDPEIADTLTIGAVFQPRFLPGFAATIDLFDIEIDNAIQQIGQDTILTTCGETGDPTFCSLINRDALGSLWVTSNGFVVDQDQNIGGFSTRGVDLSASYNREIGAFGSVGLSFNGTWLDELVTDNGVTDPYNCVGLYGNVCGVPTPKWRHTARVSLTTPSGIGASLRWRHFGSVDQDSTELGGTVHPAHQTLPSVNYFDLALTARIGDHYNFRLGANNILDKDPPLVGQQACPAGFCNGNTWSQVYDALGRYIYAGVTLEF